MSDIYLITGGTSDIGIELLTELLQHNKGDELYIVQGFNDLFVLQELQQQYPDRIEGISVDLSELTAVDQFLDSITSKYSYFTHYAHMPGMPMVYRDLANFDQAHFRKDFQLQVGSAIAISQRVLPKMAERRQGKVLFMLSSIVVSMPPQHCAAYNMVKHALYGLMKSLAADYATDNITVNAVAPSMIETKFIKNVPEEVIQASRESIPMKRNGLPKDLATAMAFLLGEGSEFITGVTLPVAGGLVI